MATPIMQRQVRLQKAPEQQVQVQSFWEQPQGLDLASATNRVGKAFATVAKNVVLNRGYLTSRPGTNTYAASTAGSTGTQMQVVNFIRSTGESYVVRFDTDYLYKWTGIAWVKVTGAGPFTGTTTDYWTFTAWNDTLIVSNGVDGTYTVDVVAGTMAIIAAAPAAKQLTTWAGRLIASYTVESGLGYGNRVKWSVKNSSTDWTGFGSGYEDMLSTPGGEVDMLMGVYPVTEEAAFVVRSNSIWQISQTGQSDLPFRFTRVYNQLGCRAAHSVQSTPEGIVFYGTDNIYEVTLSGIQAIGTAIRSELLNIIDPTKCWGLYNPLTRQYHLGVGETSNISLDVDWVYSFVDKGWTRYEFPFSFRTFGYTRYTVSGSIDSLTGTIDALVGIIDLLGQVENGEGMFIVGATAGKYILLLDTTRTQDVDLDGVGVDSPIALATGVIPVVSTLERTKLVQVELEYTATVDQTLTFKFSDDGGTTFTTFGGSKTITATTKPKVLRVAGVAERDSLMTELTSSTLGGLTVIAYHNHVVQGSRINP